MFTTTYGDAYKKYASSAYRSMESFEEMLQVYLSRAPSPSVAKSARTHGQAHPVSQTHESLSFSLSLFLSFSLSLTFSLTPSCAREQRMQMEHSKEMQNQFAFGLDGREQGNKVCVLACARARACVNLRVRACAY